jgi:hypothetical protein
LSSSDIEDTADDEELDELSLAFLLVVKSELSLELELRLVLTLKLKLRLFAALLMKKKIRPPAIATTINPKHPAPPQPRAIF